jgi:hypothetical protein
MEETKVENAEQVEQGEQEKAEAEGEQVDLNKVFQDEDRDLNSMFPDSEMRKFLKRVNRNRRSNEKFLAGIKRDKVWQEDE